jgi:hypothetical protein
VLGKRRVPALLKNLQHGLLDQSVHDARHAERSDPALRLGDFDPQCSRGESLASQMVIPSTPGLPLFDDSRSDCGRCGPFQASDQPRLRFDRRSDQKFRRGGKSG